MKKAAIVTLVSLLTILALSPAVVSAKPVENILGLRGIIGQAGNSNNAFTELWEKDPETWEVVEDGAWAKFKYSLTGETFDFHLTGHALEPGVSYSLIYYPDPWPGSGLEVLGEATADDEGNILIKGSADIGQLPAEGDENEGAKIWLVLSDDLGDGQMAGWTPSEYLFEYSLINFNAEEEAEAEAETDESGTPPGLAVAEAAKADKSNNGKAKGKNK